MATRISTTSSPSQKTIRSQHRRRRRAARAVRRGRRQRARAPRRAPGAWRARLAPRRALGGEDSARPSSALGAEPATSGPEPRCASPGSSTTPSLRAELKRHVQTSTRACSAWRHWPAPNHSLHRSTVRVIRSSSKSSVGSCRFAGVASSQLVLDVRAASCRTSTCESGAGLLSRGVARGAAVDGESRRRTTRWQRRFELRRLIVADRRRQASTSHSPNAIASSTSMSSVAPPRP